MSVVVPNPDLSIMMTSKALLITQAIKGMPCLTKLTLKVKLQASFRINFASLEEIYTRDCLFGFWVDECTCPSLRVFTSCYNLEDERRNGVKPFFRITQEEMEHDFGAIDVVVSWGSSFCGHDGA